MTKLFLLGDDSKAHAVAVETGKEGPGWVEVLGAKLPANSKVITTGQGSLAEDTPVVVRKDEVAAKPGG